MTTSRATVSVLIVDDHPVTRAGIIALLGRDDRVQVAGETGDLKEVWKSIGGEAPDVVLLDINMGAVDGVNVCARIKAEHPEVAVLMLTAYADESHVRSAIDAGANGYILKDGDGPELIRRVLEAVAG